MSALDKVSRVSTSIGSIGQNLVNPWSTLGNGIDSFLKNKNDREALEKKNTWDKLVQERQESTWTNQDDDRASALSEKARKEFTQGIIAESLNKDNPLKYIEDRTKESGGYSPTVQDMNTIRSVIRDNKSDEWNEKEKAQKIQTWAQNNTLFNKKLAALNRTEKEDNNYANIISSINGLPTTKKEYSQGEFEKYNSTKNELESTINTYQRTADRIAAAGKPVDEKITNIINNAKTSLAQLQEPAKYDVAIPKEEYLSSITPYLEKMQINNPSTQAKVMSNLKNRLELLYPSASEASIKRANKKQEDALKLQERMKTIYSLGKSVYGEKGWEKFKKDNPGITLDATEKLVNKKLNTAWAPSKGNSIITSISKLVSDGDSSSQGDIAEQSAEIKRILKEEYKGDKEAMMQDIRADYAKQGKGMFRNWLGGSPIGDALDNIIENKGGDSDYGILWD